MPVAEQPQHMQALARATEIRLACAAERKLLRSAPASDIEAALLEPTEALACATLKLLFASRGGLIPRFGASSLSRLLSRASLSNLRVWHSEMRLRDLTERERRLLVAALQPYLKRAGK